GWRTTFIIFGLPGVAIAALLYFTTEEPTRGASEPIGAGDSEAPPFKTVASHMWRQKSTRHLVAGSSVAAFVDDGHRGWLWHIYRRETR
ncbi:MAG: MFS transporter, partial [Proteobacteria bacterium]|nr:MFS transporter [Pseudomonadota bacterium]